MNPDSSTLAEALRAWRDRVTPAAAGLPAGGDRRVPGLRREELAMLAGLSVDYLVRLEQGRSENPSPQTVSALARALRLNSNERDLLYQLAGAAPPRSGLVPTVVRPGIQRMMDRFGDVPAAVFTAGWTLIQSNSAWAALLGDSASWSGRDRNLVWRHFLGDSTRIQHLGDELQAYRQEIVADLRLAMIRYPDDPELAALLRDLTAASPEFVTVWERFELGPHVIERKVVHHPVVGDLTLDCEVLSVAGADVKLIVYTAEPGSEDASKLDLVRVAGLQELAT